MGGRRTGDRYIMIMRLKYIMQMGVGMALNDVDECVSTTTKEEGREGGTISERGKKNVHSFFEKMRRNRRHDT